MTLFSYKAMNEDGKEVRGSIDSTDAEAARDALTDLHLEVLEIGEATRTQTTSRETAKPMPMQSLGTFAYEGKDAGGAVHRGTVQAQNKFAAFNQLKKEQSLFLTMLAPMGTLPKYNDPDLLAWQKTDSAPAPEKTQPKAAGVPSAPVVPKQERKSIGFTMPDSSKTPASAMQAQEASTEREQDQNVYHSLMDTFALYAGWLLAWYGLFVALGLYADTRVLPWDIPFVRAFYVSPLIFSFTVAIFFFLLLKAVHKKIEGGCVSGIVLTVVGILLVAGARMLF